MIVRQFITWVRTAPAGERAEATRCLARAWLVSDLSEDDRAAAEGALLVLLDDASPLVRQAMAEVFAHAVDAPPAIVATLAVDQPAVAMPILEHSPLLLDADLVDIVATGNSETQCAIARRSDLPASVGAAIAEVGCPAAALELIENPVAQLAPFSLRRIAERHGHLAAIREALLILNDLPAEIRLMLAEKLSGTLAQFVAGRAWLDPERAQRVAGEAVERSTVNIAAQTRGKDMTAFVGHLRAAGQLNTGLILRTLLSGNVELFEESLVELSGMPRSRVVGIVHDRSGMGLNALLAKAGLPESTFTAFRSALEAQNEIGFVGTVGGATRLRRRMVERVLTHCETSETVAEPLLILLRRFATESAREEARLYCDELAADDFINALNAQAAFEQFDGDAYREDAAADAYMSAEDYVAVDDYADAESYAQNGDYLMYEDDAEADEYAPGDSHAEDDAYAQAGQQVDAGEYALTDIHAGWRDYSERQYSERDYGYENRLIAA